MTTALGSGHRASQSGPLRTLCFHAVAVALVIAFVNAFELWRLSGTLLGSQVRDAGPFIVMGIGMVALAVVLIHNRLRGLPTLSWPWLVVAGVVASVGLAITDPAVPSKRIHVPEYMLLSGVVAAALGPGVRGIGAAILVAFTTALYGVHDEFLQGFHPLRTFGLRDIVVNAIGALAGACVFHAWSVRRAPAFRAAVIHLPPVVWGAMVLSIVGVVLTAMVLPWYRYYDLPLWAFAPLAASAVLLAFVARSRPDLPGLGITVVLQIALMIYPVLSHVASFEFA